MDTKGSVCLRLTVNLSAFLSPALVVWPSIHSTSVILLDLSMPVMDGRPIFTFRSREPPKPCL